jgi:hypothetical protein
MLSESIASTKGLIMCENTVFRKLVNQDGSFYGLLNAKFALAEYDLRIFDLLAPSQRLRIFRYCQITLPFIGHELC